MKKKTKIKKGTPNIKQIEKKIKSIVAEILEIDERKITPKARFVDDLGMDSMRALEILAAIEKTYKIEIPEEDLAKITSYNEVIKLARDLLAKNGNNKTVKNKKKHKKV